MTPAVSPRLAFEKIVLRNGLQLLLHLDRKLPVAHVNLWYHVGSKNEKPGKTGFAHLFEHMMFQGSKNVGREYISLMERAGANLSRGGVNGTTDFDRTNYFETVPSGALEMVLWAESDRMGYLLDALTQENLDNQRDVVRNERRQRMENVPYGRWDEILFESLFPKGHPYAWHVIGSMEDLARASVQDVKEFFQTYYAPNNATLVVAGDVEPTGARDLVERYFGALAPGPLLVRPERWVPALDSERRLVVADRVPQERLYLAWPGAPYFDPADAPLDLLSQLLTDGKNSRLFKRLVYDDQVASDVSAFHYSLEIAGVLGVVATARPGVSLERIEAIVDEETDRFIGEGPTEKELSRVKARQEFTFLSGLERIGGFGGKADRLAMYNTYLGSPDFIAEDYARYQSVTREDVRAAAERTLNRLRLVVSFVPESSARPGREDIDRSREPAVGATSHFATPEVVTDRLGNGLTLHVVERREIPKVAVTLVVARGADAERSDRAGLSWMVAEMLDEGTTTRSALEIEADLDDLGTALSTGGSREWSLVSLEALKRNLEPSLDLMADVLLRPSFPEAELERARKQRLDGILQERASANATAGRVVRKLLFGAEHPYGRPVAGDEGSVKRLTCEELRSFYGACYAPQEATLIFVGDVTHGEAKALAEDAFGGWTSRTLENVHVTPVHPGGRRLYVVDRADSPQSEIRLAVLLSRRDSPDRHALDVLNTIVGGGFTSRLNLNLREEKGYTYGAFSALGYGRVQGMWLSYAPVETAVTGEALREMLKEMEDLASGRRPIIEKELTEAQATLIRGYAQRFETLSQVAGELTALVGFRLPLEELRLYTEAVSGVTIESLQRMAGLYLKPEEMVLLVVGDRAKIEGGLAALGPIHVLDTEGDPV